jgi:2',3'-cyclic-nucleotide 2'-phosphodiesterase (5'-nucleotidase family)
MEVAMLPDESTPQQPGPGATGDATAAAHIPQVAAPPAASQSSAEEEAEAEKVEDKSAAPSSGSPPSQPSDPLLSLWHWTLLALAILTVAGALYLRYRYMPPDDPSPPVRLIVIQLNDTYRLDPVRDGKRGGLGRVASLLRRLKTQNPKVPVIVVHAGDFLAPSLESKPELFRGLQMIDALNFLNSIAPVYAVPGNHEFDDPNPQMLADAIERSQFQWVASNLRRDDDALAPVLRQRAAERLVLRFGGLKVALFGLTIGSAHRGKDRTYAPIDADYAAAARRQIEQMEREGADIIFGLTHLDIEDDRELAKLRREHPRFQWIAGGHEHHLQREPGWDGGALLTKGESNARTVWKVSVFLKRGRPEVREESVAIDETIQADPSFSHAIEDFYRSGLRDKRPYLDDVVSTQPGRCYDGTEEVVRDKESDWGSFLADSMRKAYRDAPADIAVINAGSIRIDDTFCDKITFEHLERTFAFPSPVAFVKLTGKEVREQILEHAVGSERGDGRFLQVSGIRFRREPGAAGGSVLRDLKVQSGKGWADLQENKTYVVAVPGFLFECGDGYQFRSRVKEYIAPGPDLRQLTYTALTVKASKQPPPIRGRIINLPSYAKQYVPTKGTWTRMTNGERKCS